MHQFYSFLGNCCVFNILLAFCNESFLCMYVCNYVCLYVCMYVCMYVCIYLFIYFRERKSGREEQREGERGSQAGSMLSMEPNTGLDPLDHDPSRSQEPDIQMTEPPRCPYNESFNEAILEY